MGTSCAISVLDSLTTEATGADEAHGFHQAFEEAFASALADQVVAFPWQRGDVLLVDNTRMMHDGLPGVGPRKLHVALLQ